MVKRRAMRALVKFALGLSAALGGWVALVIAHVALQHNPQGAYCEYGDSSTDCTIQWSLVLLALAWFVQVSVPVFGTTIAIGALVRGAVRKLSNSPRGQGGATLPPRIT